MTRRRTLAKVLAAVCLIAFLGGVAVATAGGDDELVVFNTKTLKYHCLQCQYAVKCTKNCVTIKKSEAVKRGGVPCKVCGGSCQQASSTARAALPDRKGGA